eukprot:TRINITY_DN1625_c0_g1_i4.p1 TRINITY_DN1625_c0_g1~~TRINITY_DN1625_c0_g1_i4.p1  ORF type:complete len:191 (+),score=12.84 TRINITY_DN1625_c0_g1_i4:63-635(+)
MVPHFVLAISVYYAANALRRDVETDRGSDMQVRATGTVNGSDVAHDQSLSSKGRLSNPSPGINAKEMCIMKNWQCGGKYMSFQWSKLKLPRGLIGSAAYPTKCCDASQECFKVSNDWSICQPPKSPKEGEEYNDQCAPHGGVCGFHPSQKYRGPTCCQAGQRCGKPKNAFEPRVCEDNPVAAEDTPDAAE